jgi:hypothetical protein
MFNKPATGDAPQPPPPANAHQAAPDPGTTQSPESPPVTPQASDGTELNEQQ